MRLVNEEFIRNLKDLTLDLQVWGNKSCNLYKLMMNNIPVPEGYVISSDVFLKYQKITDAKSLQIFLNELEQKVTPFIKKLNSKKIICRSSANIEGLKGICCSGMFESVECTSSDFMKGIIAVWDSAKSVEVEKYLTNHNIEIKEIRMSVLIQGVKSGDISGVMHTKDIIGGSDKIIIEYCDWRIEGVVDGNDNSEMLVLDNRGRMIHGKWPEKVNRNQMNKLVHLGKTIEAILNGNAEIEFLIDERNIYFLQARLLEEESYE